MGVSTAAILTSVFCAEVRQFSAGGYPVQFDPALIPIALGAALVYLGGLFAWYGWSDHLNRGRTPADHALSEARQAVLTEVERNVKGAAFEVSSSHQMPDRAGMVSAVVDVFWHFKSHRDDSDGLYRALERAGVPAVTISRY